MNLLLQISYVDLSVGMALTLLKYSVLFKATVAAPLSVKITSGLLVITFLVITRLLDIWLRKFLVLAELKWCSLSCTYK